MSQIGAELAAADPDKLDAAVNAVLAVHQQSLIAGAKETPATADDELTDAAVFFHTLLELAYLVASADGFAGSERTALAQLIETATEATLDRTVLLAHFDDLESSSAVLGRRERLARAAANVDQTDKRKQALEFATLISAADGNFDSSELDVLVELGEHFGIDRDGVETIAKQVVSEIAEQLEGAQ